MSPLLQTAPTEAKRNTSEEAPEVTVARYLLANHPRDVEASSVYQLAPAVRHYLSGLNLADQVFIAHPLFLGLDESESTLAPHELMPRDRQEWRERYPDPDGRLDSRRGMALEYLGEALDELRDFLVNTDLINNRLISAVAGAMRSEIKRLVDYIDAGCPAELVAEVG